MSITKKLLSKRISNNLDISQKHSYEIVKDFFSFISENHTKNVNIRNFGTFSFKKTPRRIGRNPKSLQKFEIKARGKIHFIVSDEVRKLIN